MKFQTTSFKAVIEKIVSSGFEKTILEELEKSKQRCLSEIDQIFAEARKEAKKQSHQLTVDLLNKCDSTGLSLEIRF